MVQIVAWILLIVGLALRVGDGAYQVVKALPWNLDSLSSPLIFFLGPPASGMLPYLGAWLLAEADRVRSPRWWIGAIFLLTLLDNRGIATTPFGGDYFGQDAVWVLGNCLPVWPIWHLTRRKRGQVAGGDGECATA